MKKTFNLLPLFSLIFVLVAGPSAHAVDPRSYAVELSAAVQAAPPRITLKWTADNNATGYSVYRKAPAASNWSLLASLPASASTWADIAVANGGSYEYAVTRSTSSGYAGTGYLLAGINAPVMEYRGKLILMVDNTHSTALAAELTRLQQDLTGDGWTVLRHDVSRSATVASVKNLIKADYQADPANVKAVFLFGHVPVPYSGNLNPPPDGHIEHQGAWPADAYYGEMDGSWTDSTVNNSSAARSANRNIPGDGKFDQSDLPSDVDLQVGRVDLANMTCFANKTPARSELDLLRAYLDKNHRFRTGALQVPRRGLVRDSFGDIYGENFASSGWRNSSSFFGPENSFAAPYNGYISTLRDNAYLWSYGAGGGTYTGCDGVATSDDFSLNNVKTVFVGLLGSYFGDWDNESAFLRAPLGSGYCLATLWSGRPHWFLHHMALGETIGYSARVSQNNTAGGLYGTQNWGTHRVHIALMGDPSLRLHPVLPPSNLAAATTAGVSLNWSASADSNIQGYLVYRASSPAGPFTRISGDSLLTTLGMTDPAGAPGSVYMVRAVKLEQSAGGTYYNPSVGIFATAPAAVDLKPAAPSNLTATPVSKNSIRLQWQDNSANESGFNLMRKAGAAGAYISISVPANSTSFIDSGLTLGTQYFYKINSWNSAGQSAFTSELAIGTSAPQPSSGTFLGVNSTTRGSWKGVFGREGYNIIGDQALYSIPVTVQPSGQTQWIWNWLTPDPSALLRSTADTRLASCWYSRSALNVSLSFQGTNRHKLSIYFLDWDGAGRIQTVELLDSTQNVLHSQSLSNFQNGVYLSFDVSGSVTLRVRPANGTAVISGIFLDPIASPAQVAAPAFSPAGGTLTNGQTISISCATPGATIRYTTDGAAPTVASSAYSGPFTLPASAVVSAKAFASGMTDSTVSTASFTVPAQPVSCAKASFLGLDTTRRGNWKGYLGSGGYSIPGDAQFLPWPVALSSYGKSDWVWSYVTVDPRAPLRASLSSRHASCAYGTSFEYDLNPGDGKTHNLALYCLDWDRLGREQTIELLDFDTRKVLHTYRLSAFTEGVYLNYAVKGHVTIRFKANLGPNAVLSGIFIDSATTEL